MEIPDEAFTDTFTRDAYFGGVLWEEAAFASHKGATL